jgi:transcriptional regulator with XRE-family HTH domain
MTGVELRDARRSRRWTQVQLAQRLGVTQGYVCLLERGRRALPRGLAQKVARLLAVPATALPVGPSDESLDDSVAASTLGALGYPGFAYLRRGRTLNPAEALLRTLKMPDLSARVVEGLVWLAFQYPDMDWHWVVREARADDLQNRLGFLVTLARQLAEEKGRRDAGDRLVAVERRLAHSRLQREDAFRSSMTDVERNWLRQHRPAEAAYWNVLTNLTANELTRAVDQLA